MLKRRDVPIWVFPGGGVDPGETPAEAVLREIHEETGLEAEIVRQVGEYTPLNRLARLTHVFECRVKGGHLTTGAETKELRFYPVSELPKEAFTIHTEWLDDALLHRKELIRRAITSVTYSKLLFYFCKHPVQVFRLFLSRMGIPWNSR